MAAIESYPNGLQIGGGINPDNAEFFLSAGASQVIVTSWVFPELRLDLERLKIISHSVGKTKLVLDLSCRKLADGWSVAKDKWQTVTEEKITPEFLSLVSEYCCEF